MKDKDRPVAKQDPRNEAVKHPVGTGLGAVAGGIAAGAAVGTTAGPIGTAVGAAAGAIAGALAGQGIAHMIHPEHEDAYWRENYKTRAYFDEGFTYDNDYAPAYRYGWEAYPQYQGRDWDEVEADLGAGWDKARGQSSLTWERAKHATRDSWHRVSDAIERATPGDSDRDGK